MSEIILLNTQCKTIIIFYCIFYFSLFHPDLNSEVINIQLKNEYILVSTNRLCNIYMKSLQYD